jgi:virginiamycin B lyase
MREFPAPTRDGGPHTLVISDDGSTIWFTLQSGDRIGRLDTASGKITEYPTSGGPYGITLDRQGRVWFCRMGDDRLGILDPATGKLAELVLPEGSRPRRMATAPDGSLWVTLYGHNKLVQVDPAARRVVREVALPAGPRGGAYAVTVDGAGTVWANEIRSDSVVRFEPKRGELKVVNLPTPAAGIRKMVVDARGQLWYMGSQNGRLGRVR